MECNGSRSTLSFRLLYSIKIALFIILIRLCVFFYLQFPDFSQPLSVANYAQLRQNSTATYYFISFLYSLFYYKAYRNPLFSKSVMPLNPLIMAS